MKPKIVPPREVATEIAESLRRLAGDVELRGNAEERQVSATTRLQELMTMFTLDESLRLIKMIVEPRVKCRRCNAGRPMRECSGAYCLECATLRRREAEAAS